MNTIKRKILLFGCQKIAIDIIDIINKHNEAIGVDTKGNVIIAELVGVVTHDEERDRLFGSKLVSEHCDENNIDNIRFDKKIDIDFIKKKEPDIIFSIYYRKLLSKDVIDIPRLGIINVHPARLPENRGPNPTYWAVRKGEYNGFTTLHYIDEGMDTGDIIDQRPTLIRDLSGFDANKKMMDLGTEMFKENYETVMCEKNNREKQDHRHATCNVSFKNDMRFIDWGNSSRDIRYQILAHASPYAGSIAWSSFGEHIIVHEAEILDKSRSPKGPGTFNKDEDCLIVQTYDRPIKITNYISLGKQLRDKGRFEIGINHKEQ